MVINSTVSPQGRDGNDMFLSHDRFNTEIGYLLVRPRQLCILIIRIATEKTCAVDDRLMGLFYIVFDKK